ncbi:uncharacterized protein LOC122011605 [Zingiber officinale]|uniref:uncharacterized protein LOC122011605 n=1 Tax=Zingiber officinale TaxID=94328 RepID=UPI001C4B5A28|nr:uncharacterized protein LOC122011605 [Zingiber officinale]
MYSASASQSPPPLPFHLLFFLLTLLLLLGVSWYTSYEAILEGVFYQLKFLLVVSPLLLLIVLHWLSSDGLSFLVPFPEKESLHRAGGSPWGVGFLLLLLILMISYQSYFQDRWFPLSSR